MLTAVRKGEIALSMVKSRIQDEGLSNLNPNSVRRAAGSEAKKLGISEAEFMDFAREMAAEVLSEAFGKKVEWGDDLKAS